VLKNATAIKNDRKTAVKNDRLKMSCLEFKTHGFVLFSRETTTIPSFEELSP
jgi:hypothetical protein